jgi:hypothetical protein
MLRKGIRLFLIPFSKKQLVQTNMYEKFCPACGTKSNSKRVTRGAMLFDFFFSQALILWGFLKLKF